MGSVRKPTIDPVLARASVGVLGSGTRAWSALARPLGALLARLGVNLVTGGGRGVMRAVARAYVQSERARGLSIGIIPCASLAERGTPLRGYPNPFVELPIYTHLPFSGTAGTGDLSRNHINVLSSAVLVALPGSHGTASEVTLALRYRRPVIVFAPDAATVAHFPAEAPRTRDIEAVETFLRQHLPVGEDM
jgi:uncharacterized protein (TIGR00725 family)